MQLVNPFMFTPSTKDWTFINSTTTGTSSLTLPASIDAGDLLIIFNSATQQDLSPTLVTPSGFTNKLNNTYSRLTNSSRAAVHVKKAIGTEDGSVVSVMNPTPFDSGIAGTAICLQFRPVNFSITSVGNITLGNVDSEGYYGNPGSVTSTATGVKLPAIAFGNASSYTKSGLVDFSAQSPTFDGSVQTSFSDTHQQIVGYRIQEDVVTSQTIDMTDQGTMNYLFAFQLYDNGL